MTLWNEINLNSDDQEVREFKFKSKTENNSFKTELYTLFFSKINKNEKIHFLNQYEVDEISFEINHNSSSKTFYLKNKGSMRANIDVTKRLDFVNSEPTFHSLRKVALELIYEILDYRSSDFDEVA